jgi:hypothetical protein
MAFSGMFYLLTIPHFVINQEFKNIVTSEMYLGVKNIYSYRKQNVNIFNSIYVSFSVSE